MDNFPLSIEASGLVWMVLSKRHLRVIEWNEQPDCNPNSAVYFLIQSRCPLHQPHIHGFGLRYNSIFEARTVIICSLTFYRDLDIQTHTRTSLLLQLTIILYLCVCARIHVWIENILEERMATTWVDRKSCHAEDDYLYIQFDSSLFNTLLRFYFSNNNKV